MVDDHCSQAIFVDFFCKDEVLPDEPTI